MVFPLPCRLKYLWEWLWCNYKPAEGESEGVSKEDVVQELLEALPQQEDTRKRKGAPLKEGYVKALHAIIARCLTVMYADSPLSKKRFNGREKNVFLVRRVITQEKEKRKESIPECTIDLRKLLLLEVGEERMGRSSARNLLQLMDQGSPNKKKRIEGTTDTQEEENILSSNPNNTTTTTTTDSADSKISQPTQINKETSNTKTKTVRRTMFRKQTSSPNVLPRSSTFGTNSGKRSFNRKEPWKREVDELWNRTIGLMTEVKNLKTELTFRQEAKKREILMLRTEIERMKVEMLRQTEIIKTLERDQGRIYVGPSTDSSSQ